jgi:glutamate-1-semialdehyde 2,1-aminomutase
VRELTLRNGAVLIFDEVITGYRLALDGAQGRYGVTPDLTVLGKALGAGFPISAVCGRADVLEAVSSTKVAHVGTFNANPVCAAAAFAAIRFLEEHRDELYPALEARARSLAAAVVEGADEGGLALQANYDVGVVCAFAGARRPASYLETLDADAALFRRFAAALLAEGVHVIPRGLLYVSTEHTAEDIVETRAAVTRAAEATVEERDRGLQPVA